MKKIIYQRKGQSFIETLIFLPMVFFSLFAVLELILNLHLFYIADSLGFDYLICKNASHVDSSSTYCEQKILLPLQLKFKNKISWQSGTKEIHFKIKSNLLPNYNWRKQYDP